MNITYFFYKEIAHEEWLSLSHSLHDEMGFHLAVSHIDPQDINPAFEPLYLSKKLTFERLYNLISKYGHRVKHYEVGIFRNKKCDSKNMISEISVKRHKVNNRGDDYSKIYICDRSVNMYIEPMIPRVHELVQQKLGLEKVEPPQSAILGSWLKDRLRSADLRSLTINAFTNEQYDAALGAACAYVEKELRAHITNNGGEPLATDAGVELSKLAYHNDDGVLSPPYPVAAQANHGAFLMVQGFMLYLRNGFLHNKVAEMDPEIVCDLLCMCDSMLALINNSQKRS